MSGPNALWEHWASPLGGEEGQWPDVHFLFHLFPPRLVPRPPVLSLHLCYWQEASIKDLEPHRGGNEGLDMELLKGLFSTDRCSFHPPPARPTHVHAADTVHDLLPTHRQGPTACTQHLPRSAALFNATDVTQMLGCHSRLPGGGWGRGATRRAGSGSVSSNVPFLRTATSPELFKGRSVVYFSKSATVNQQA